MAGPLNLVYSALALVVALVGLAFVLGFTGDDDTDWWSMLAVLVVGVFLVVMVGELTGLL